MPSGGCWKTSSRQPENTILLTYIVYFSWFASLIGYGYIAVRHPMPSYARFVDYAALAFWGGTWLLFSGLFVLHSFSPTAQANADNAQAMSAWQVWFELFPALYFGHIALLLCAIARLALPPYPPRAIHYAALLLALLSGYHVGVWMPNA